MKKNGFTLIELLVVISIIGILAGLTLSSFSGAQKQARDTTRRSDLGQYRLALEAYSASNNQKYPGLLTADNCTQDAGGKLYTQDDTLLRNYMSGLLEDPKNEGNYIYKYCEDGSSRGPNAMNYIVYGGLETGGFWIICSNGKSGKVTVAPTKSDNCQL